MMPSARSGERRPHLLIADHDPGLRLQLRRILEAEGYTVAEATDGGALARKLDATSPDAVISGVRMPGRTGLEVLERLRERDWALPVILMSTLVDAGLWSEAGRLGAWDVLQKPIDATRLRATLHAVAPPCAARRLDAYAGPLTPRSCRPRILVAEDDGELRELLARKLEERGMDIRRCRHGVDLASELDRAFGDGSDGSRVDAVISDIRMPGVTGMSLLEELHEAGHPCPIVLITAFGDDETHARARCLRASAVFDKPFDVERLLNHVEKLLEITQRPLPRALIF